MPSSQRFVILSEATGRVGISSLSCGMSGRAVEEPLFCFHDEQEPVI
jgi:hypothetical protein